MYYYNLYINMITHTSPQHFVLIPAAGIGTRLKSLIPKQYMLLANKPMLQYVLDVFIAHTTINHIYIVVSATDCYIDNFFNIKSHILNKITILRIGGNTRQDTVLNGLQAIYNDVSRDDWILVHDAARPGLNNILIDKLLQTLNQHPVGGLLALPVIDTLKYSVAQHAQKTLSHKNLWIAQTPQMFRYALLLRALIQIRKQGRIAEITDDASAIEALGLHPKLIQGHICNFKVTLASDIKLATFFIKKLT